MSALDSCVHHSGRESVRAEIDVPPTPPDPHMPPPRPKTPPAPTTPTDEPPPEPVEDPPAESEPKPPYTVEKMLRLRNPVGRGARKRCGLQKSIRAQARSSARANSPRLLFL